MQQFQREVVLLLLQRAHEKLLHQLDCLVEDELRLRFVPLFHLFELVVQLLSLVLEERLVSLDTEALLDQSFD